ncbi:hypothetical protein, partial [Halanaerobium sp. MA284_MarDTE_T2]|uniref:hypothetical protein n=1 Tax=unclassified Halanaerobium TaxID=2641197 RepID=UPI00351155F9
PWSTCPIVPMLTCGFVLSNFFFAIFFVLLKIYLRMYYVFPGKNPTKKACQLQAVLPSMTAVIY